MTHWGDAAAYKRFASEIAMLMMPMYPMVGNHDDTPSLTQTFPDVARDENGFVHDLSP